MNKSDQENITNNPAEISLKDAILELQAGIRYIKSKWLKILIFGAIGGLIGLTYSLFTKPSYTAVCTFVLDEDSKGGSLGQYSGLASLAGIDLGSGAGSNTGLFSSDNIMELYKSRLMIEKALLSPAIFNGKKELLIDRYIDYNKLRRRWRENDDIENITFTGDPDNFSRNQDSIITDLVELFNKKVLDVSKLDKKLSIIKVEVKSKDELFAKGFTEQLVQTVNNFYIETKTKKATENVKILQKQADSVRLLLNSSFSKVASAMEADPNANPALVSLKVPSQKRQVDLQQNTAVYTEVVRNLEASKMSLRKETPLIQIIDKPVLPLKKNRIKEITGMLIGSILSVFIAIAGIGFKKMYNNLMK